MERINILGRKVHYIFFFALIVNLTFFMALSAWATTDPPYEIQWGVQRGSTGTDIAYGIAGDNAGSIYVTGNTNGSIDGQPPASSNDLFLIKYDDRGNWKWTRQLGSNPGNEWANAVAVVKDMNGDAYVVGRTNGAMPGNSNYGGTDVFIAKYNSNGSIVWIRQIGSSGQDIAYATGIDQAGNVYITGRTNGSLPGHTNKGANDMFLLKYNPAGTLVWSKQVGTSSDDEAYALTIDSANRIYIGGYTTGTYNGPGESHNRNAGGKDILIMRFDSNGVFCCSKQYGSALDDVATSIGVDSFDNVYIVGNTGYSGSTVPTLMKCNLYGTVWYKSLELQVEEIVSSLTIDHMNNIYVAGHANINRSGIIDKDVSIAKYDGEDGTLIWTRQIGTTVDERATSLTTDSFGSIYVTGCTNGSLFGTNTGGSDVFVAKLVDITPPTGTVKINSEAAYTNSTSVTLTLACDDGSGSGCSAMRFSNNGSAWSDWITQTATLSWTVSKPWTITSGDGSKTVDVQYRDVAGNVSTSTISDDIILDTTPPSGSIIINSDATYVNSTSVTLALSCNDSLSGCSQMCISNTTSCSAWETFAASKPWTLTSGDGTKTVYVKFRDRAGNESGNFIDTIILDTVLPTGSVVINSGDAYTNSPSVSLTLACSDSASGCDSMQFSNNNSVWSSWEAYRPNKTWSLSGGDGVKTVYVRFKDQAGNVLSVNSTITLHITLQPDIAVSSIVVPRTAGSGLAINITDTTANRGKGGAGRSTTVFYFSTDNILDDDDELIGSREVPAIAPGGSNTATTSVTIPSDIETGSYYIIAVADVDEMLDETNENNNKRARGIKIGSDLTVSVNAPSRVGVGTTITITVTTANKTMGVAGESTTGIYLSRDAILSPDDIELGTETVPVLGGGASSRISALVDMPADIVNGVYYIIAKADIEDDVRELNENNNIKSRKVMVGLDMAIASISAPSTVESGDSFNVTVTTINRGPGSSPETITGIYLSKDGVLSPDDIELDQLEIEGLSAGRSNAQTIEIDAPVEIGTYYIIAKADADNSVVEFSEANNVRAKAIKVIQVQ